VVLIAGTASCLAVGTGLEVANRCGGASHTDGEISSSRSPGLKRARSPEYGRLPQDVPERTSRHYRHAIADALS
jgi:hypothetical protein